MGLAAIAAHKLGGIIPVGAIFKASFKIGQATRVPTAQSTSLEDRLRVLR
jgi:hypothetical protein